MTFENKIVVTHAVTQHSNPNFLNLTYIHMNPTTKDLSFILIISSSSPLLGRPNLFLLLCVIVNSVCARKTTPPNDPSLLLVLLSGSVYHDQLWTVFEYNHNIEFWSSSGNWVPLTFVPDKHYDKQLAINVMQISNSSFLDQRSKFKAHNFSKLSSRFVTCLSNNGRARKHQWSNPSFVIIAWRIWLFTSTYP